MRLSFYYTPTSRSTPSKVAHVDTIPASKIWHLELGKIKWIQMKLIGSEKTAKALFIHSTILKSVVRLHPQWDINWFCNWSQWLRSRDRKCKSHNFCHWFWFYWKYCLFRALYGFLGFLCICCLDIKHCHKEYYDLIHLKIELSLHYHFSKLIPNNKCFGIKTSHLLTELIKSSFWMFLLNRGFEEK